METFEFDADCGIEDAENHVNITLGLVEDQQTGLLRFDDEVIVAQFGEDGLIFDEETEFGYITYA